MAIKNIVFDIGNVLADYRWYDFLKDKGFSHDMIDRIAGNSTLSPLWNEYDRGVLTAEQVVNSFIRRDPEIADAFHIAFDNLKDLVTPFDYAVELVRSLGGAGYRVYYLSNYSQKALEDCPDAMGFLPYTDGGIFSFRESSSNPTRLSTGSCWNDTILRRRKPSFLTTDRKMLMEPKRSACAASCSGH